MNKLKAIVIIIAVLIGVSSFQASAQSRRDKKTSSAKAYYGKTPVKPTTYRMKRKENAQKMRKRVNQPAKGTRTEGFAGWRRRSSVL